MNTLLQPPTTETQLEEWALAMMRLPYRILESNLSSWLQGINMLYRDGTAEKLAKLNGKTYLDPATGQQKAVTAELYEGSRNLTGWLLVNLGAMTPQGQMLPELAVNGDGSPKVGADGVTQLRNWKNSEMVNRILQVLASIPDTITHADGTVTLNA